MPRVGPPIEQKRLIRFCAYYYIASVKVRQQGKVARLSSRELGERVYTSAGVVRTDLGTMPGWTGKPGHTYFAYEVADRAMLWLETHVGSDDSLVRLLIPTWEDRHLAKLAANGLLSYNRERLMVR